jgi:ornithine cyclodeaminase/alanine dehydrogenase-like protein (mu-crystallin family)
VLLIDNDVVTQVLRLPDVVRALERSYRELATGEAVCRPRLDLRLPTGRPGEVYQWGTMDGGSAASGYVAIRMKSDVLREVEYAGTRTQEKHCVAPGTYCGLVFLLSARTGEPLAIVHDGVLQHHRVGADSAIGVDLAARPDAEVLGLLGSGGMARSHVEALLTVRELHRVQVYSPTRAHREQFAAEVGEQHDLEVVAVDEPEAVFRGADVVSACTDSAHEVVLGEWLEPGTHITCIGGRLDRRAREVIDVWLRLGTAPAPSSHEEWRPQQEFLAWQACPDDPVWQQHTHARGYRDHHTGGARVVTLEDVARGAPVRTDRQEVTYSERGNIQGAQFHAVAGVVYERARALGLGRELPTEWFLQSVRD